MSDALIIVGKGMAATRLVEELANRGLGRHAIAVIGAEPRPAYNRVLLSPLLAGEIAEADIELKPPLWWQSKGVSTLYGTAVARIDPVARTVTLADGLALPFKHLVLATGSRPLRPPIPGIDLPGIMTFRDAPDVEAMRAKAQAGQRIVVIGGGLLGLEAAYGLKRAGADVTVLHLVDRLMERQLDAEAAAILARAILAKGIHVRLKAATKAFLGTDRVTGVELAGGEIIPADLVVLSIGVRPNVELAAQSGITTGRGIQVDDAMESSQPGIFALGECAEHRGQVYGLVEPAYEQARVLADRLSGGSAHYEGSVLSTNLKVSGTGVFSAGEFEGSEGCEIALLQDEACGTYRKFVYRGSQLVGCILIGDTQGALWYLRLIREGIDVSLFRRDLPFGESFCTAVAA